MGIKMDEPGGAFVGAGSLWPEIMSTKFNVRDQLTINNVTKSKEGGA
jgi:hypothetical protein